MRYALFRWRLAVTAFASTLLASSPGAQQRDATVAPSGTGQIAGVVMSADATPQPVRRALVTISGDLKESRSAITDDAGRFVFGGLPAGQFRIEARKQAYLKTEYGVAKLRGRSIRERTEALIGIAHPSFRDELLAEAKDMGFV